MNRKLEAKIQKEIRRRAFERADIYRHKKQHLQKTQHTLDALAGGDRFASASIGVNCR